jgi:hypothetical protein
LVLRDVELLGVWFLTLKSYMLHLEGLGTREEFPFFDVLGPLKMKVMRFFGFCDQLAY